MRELLGVEVPNDANGVLQDVHWSSGGIGYFPTYALGNVISLQLWSVVRDAIPDLDAQMEAGSFWSLPGCVTTSTRSAASSRRRRRASGSPGRRRSTRSRISRTCATSWRLFPPVPESLTLVVNGEARTLEVEARTLLVHALRDSLELTGTHVGCDTSQWRVHRAPRRLRRRAAPCSRCRPRARR